ncbi:hypothetical protein ACE6H2_016704 [Prunus campanulata]
MRFINIPCVNPLVLDFDDHHEIDMIINNHDQLDYDDDEEGMITEDGTIINVHEEKGCADYEDEVVDIKEDEFIAKFYQQINLQRQISYLHYSSSPTTLHHTTLHSDACLINIQHTSYKLHHLRPSQIPNPNLSLFFSHCFLFPLYFVKEAIYYCGIFVDLTG